MWSRGLSHNGWFLGYKVNGLSTFMLFLFGTGLERKKKSWSWVYYWRIPRKCLNSYHNKYHGFLLFLISFSFSLLDISHLSIILAHRFLRLSSRHRIGRKLRVHLSWRHSVDYFFFLSLFHFLWFTRVLLFHIQISLFLKPYRQFTSHLKRSPWPAGIFSRLAAKMAVS